MPRGLPGGGAAGERSRWAVDDALRWSTAHRPRCGTRWMGHRPRSRPWQETPRGGQEGALSQEARHSGQAGGTDPAHDTPGMANLTADAYKSVANGPLTTSGNVANGPFTTLAGRFPASSAAKYPTWYPEMTGNPGRSTRVIPGRTRSCSSPQLDNELRAARPSPLPADGRVDRHLACRVRAARPRTPVVDRDDAGAPDGEPGAPHRSQRLAIPRPLPSRPLPN
jgi:hypothetical protein